MIRFLQILYREGVKTIPDICGYTGMSTPTVKKMLDELIEEGLVMENGLAASGGGRRPGLYGLNPSSRQIVGINIGRSEIRIGIFNLLCESLHPIEIINGGIETLNDIRPALKAKLEELIDSSDIQKSTILGAGIAMPGLIDTKTGISHSYFTDVKKPLATIFTETLGMPAYIEHDTRILALGENIYGLAKGKQNVLCLNIGSGIGLSMILNGRLYTGNSGFSGEFGHITVDPAGEQCYCGKIGCLETLASGKTLVNIARREIHSPASTALERQCGGKPELISLTMIVDAATNGDQYATTLLARAGEHLGKGIATLIHLFNPEMIIIGGKMAKAGKLLTDPIRNTMNLHTIPRIREDAEIVTSELGLDAGIMGTIALVMENTFTSN